MKIRSLAMKYQIDRGTVSVHIARLGVPRRNPRPSPADVKVASRMNESGKSLQVAGERFGAAARTVSLVLRKAGVEIRKRRGA